MPVETITEIEDDNMDIEQIAELRSSIETQKWDRPAVSPVPVAGQIHWLRERAQEPQLFFLVTACHGEYCKVIPGSFEGMYAVAPNDMILPESLLGGDYAYLSMDLIRILPTTALGDGIVRLPDRIFQKILTARDTCLAGRRRDVVAFEFSNLPYFGAADPRRGEHEYLRRAILKEQIRIFAPKENHSSILERIIQTFSSFGREVLPPRMNWPGICLSLRLGSRNLSERELASLAAAPHQDNPCGEWRIEGCSDVLFFEYDNAERKLRIKCYTPANEPSKAFNGWQLLDESSLVLGVIGSGKLAVAGEKIHGLGGLFLQSPDGRLFPLVASGEA